MAHELNIPANLVPKIWAKKVWNEGNKDSYLPLPMVRTLFTLTKI